MKKISLLVIGLAFSFQAFGDLSDQLRACQRQCAPGCQDLAEEVSRAALEIIDNCGNGDSGKVDVIKACSDIFFSSTDKQQCIRTARSAEVVRACSNVFFSTADKLTCLERARSEAVVRECADRFFSSQDKLDCIGS